MKVIKKYIWSIFGIIAVVALMLYLFISKAGYELKILALVTCYLFVSDATMKGIRTEMRDIRQEYRNKSSRERRENFKYFMRLVNFMRDSDTLKSLYEDGLLYDPDFVSNGSLTINLPNGMALCVKDAGYPVESPGVYINLRDMRGNEDCVVRAEFNADGNDGQGSLRVIAYQWYQEDAILDVDYLATT